MNCVVIIHALPLYINFAPMLFLKPSNPPKIVFDNLDVTATPWAAAALDTAVKQDEIIEIIGLRTSG